MRPPLPDHGPDEPRPRRSSPPEDFERAVAYRMAYGLAYTYAEDPATRDMDPEELVRLVERDVNSQRDPLISEAIADAVARRRPAW